MRRCLPWIGYWSRIGGHGVGFLFDKQLKTPFAQIIHLAYWHPEMPQDGICSRLVEEEVWSGVVQNVLVPGELGSPKSWDGKIELISAIKACPVDFLEEVNSLFDSLMAVFKCLPLPASASGVVRRG